MHLLLGSGLMQCHVDFANWDASVPVIVIVPIVRLADPVFVIVKTWVGLAA